MNWKEEILTKGKIETFPLTKPDKMQSSDPTINMFLTSQFDYKNLNNQVNLRCFAVMHEICRNLNNTEREFIDQLNKTP